MSAPFRRLALRPFLPTDAPLLAAIFAASVERLTGDDYDAGQQAAWASLANDEAAFAARLAGQLTLIATMDGAPVAFASLRGNDHIDMLYVHPAVARQGVATSLVDALEKLARARGAAKLTVDASDTAKPFFDKLGYAAQQRNAVAVGNEWLGNVSMQKQLPAAQSESRVQ
jgi:putative acetyltransferase